MVRKCFINGLGRGFCFDYILYDLRSKQKELNENTTLLRMMFSTQNIEFTILD